MEDEVYLVVKSIDLLTKEEAEELPKDIRVKNYWWWLQSASYSDFAKYVNNDGFVSDHGKYVGDRDGVVRPALLIENLDSLNLPLYTELEIFDEDWIYIGNNKALHKDFLWLNRFDKNSSNYKTSEIKEKLDDWLRDKKKEFNQD